jgi:hypothetical protein
MTASTPPSEFPRATRETIGRVAAVSGAQVVVALSVTAPGSSPRATVGKFLGIVSGGIVTVGMITEISERPARDQDPNCRSTAQIDIVGEIKANASGTAYFQRGITEYPTIGDPAVLMSDRELRLIYSGRSGKPSNVGVLQQDPSIATQIDIEQLVSKHFAVLGTTGTGKSNGVALLLQQTLEERPDLRIFLIDPHNEYGRCFGEKAQVLTPRNLRLPFWLFNFEETVDAFFGGRPGVEEEVEILSEAIPLPKAAYVQLKGGSSERGLMKKKDTRDAGYGVDTPVPYRIEDLITVIDDRMGKLENRARVTIYNKLLQRIKTFRNHPRYGFMFESHRRRRHHGRGGESSVPPADQRQADDDHAARGFPVGSGRLGGLRAVAHGLRLRPLERWRVPAAVRLRGGAPLCAGRQDRRLWSDQAGALAHCQGGPQVRRVPRSRDAAPGRDRSQHHLPVQHAVRHAAVQRPRPGADPLGGVGCRRQHC